MALCACKYNISHCRFVGHSVMINTPKLILQVFSSGENGGQAIPSSPLPDFGGSLITLALWGVRNKFIPKS